MTSTLKVKSLQKSFGDKKAVDGIDFAIAKGTCYGLLGPNGAGKSTTIEMIQGITKPDQGAILFNDQPIGSHFFQKLGIQLQTTALPPKLTAKEALLTFSKLYPRSLNSDDMVELCQLKEFEHQYHEKLSGGQRQRLLLAIALCHDPELILLDEPTTGLDPQARRHVWDIIQNLKTQGKTILLTTHYMDEAEQLCDVISIMDHGKILVEGPPKTLLRDRGLGAVIELQGSADELKSRLGRPFAEAKETPRGLEIFTQNLNESVAQIAQSGVDLNGMSIRHPNLEDLFIKLVGEELRC